MSADMVLAVDEWKGFDGWLVNLLKVVCSIFS